MVGFAVWALPDKEEPRGQEEKGYIASEHRTFIVSPKPLRSWQKSADGTGIAEAAGYSEGDVLRAV
jgi:hypothetical protein